MKKNLKICIIKSLFIAYIRSAERNTTQHVLFKPYENMGNHYIEHTENNSSVAENSDSEDIDVETISEQHEIEVPLQIECFSFPSSVYGEKLEISKERYDNFPTQSCTVESYCHKTSENKSHSGCCPKDRQLQIVDSISNQSNAGFSGKIVPSSLEKTKTGSKRSNHDNISSQSNILKDPIIEGVSSHSYTDSTQINSVQSRTGKIFLPNCSNNSSFIDNNVEHPTHSALKRKKIQVCPLYKSSYTYDSNGSKKASLSRQDLPINELNSEINTKLQTSGYLNDQGTTFEFIRINNEIQKIHLELRTLNRRVSFEKDSNIDYILGKNYKFPILDTSERNIQSQVTIDPTISEENQGKNHEYSTPIEKNQIRTESRETQTPRDNSTQTTNDFYHFSFENILNQYYLDLKELNALYIKDFLISLKDSRIFATKKIYFEFIWEKSIRLLLNKINRDFSNLMKNVFDIKINKKYNDKKVIINEDHSEGFLKTLRDQNVKAFKYMKHTSSSRFELVVSFSNELIKYEKNKINEHYRPALKEFATKDLKSSIFCIKNCPKSDVLSEISFFIILNEQNMLDKIKDYYILYVCHFFRILANKMYSWLSKFPTFNALNEINPNDRFCFTKEVYWIRRIFYNILLGFKDFESKAGFYGTVNILDFRQKIFIGNSLNELYLFFKLQLNMMFLSVVSPEITIDETLIRKIIILTGIICYSDTHDLKHINNKIRELKFNSETQMIFLLKSLKFIFLESKYENSIISRENLPSELIKEMDMIIDKYERKTNSSEQDQQLEIFIYKFLLQLEAAFFKFHGIDNYKIDITDELVKSLFQLSVISQTSFN